MKTKLLFAFLIATTLILKAQTTETINIDWVFNSNTTATGDENTDRTIEIGDTVVWTWVVLEEIV